MNKRGLAVFVALMLGIVFFILGLALSPALVDVATESMTQLDCTNAGNNISNYNKGVCTQIDFFAPLFMGTLFGLAGILIGGLATR